MARLGGRKLEGGLEREDFRELVAAGGFAAEQAQRKGRMLERGDLIGLRREALLERAREELGSGVELALGVSREALVEQALGAAARRDGLGGLRGCGRRGGEPGANLAIHG